MANTRIARRRLFNQRIAGTKFRTAGEVVEWMGAVQCQDLMAGQWAVALRTGGQSLAEIETAIARKAIVRTWPMRGTLHFVPPADIRWMLKYLAQRTVQRSLTRYRQLELDGQTFAKSSKILERTLGGGNQIGRKQAYDLLERNGVSCKGQRGIHILGRLAQDGLLCFGSRDGTTTTFVLLDEWVPPASIPPREVALAKLALKYFTSHGPASVNDFAWWSGLTLTEARKVFEEIRSGLVAERTDGTTYWLGHHSAVVRETVAKTYLLPAFDEFVVAYKDRTAAIDSKNIKRMHPGGGTLNPTVVHKDKVVGTWGRTIKGNKMVVHVRLFRNPERHERVSIGNAATSYGSFLGKHVVVRMNT
jgi:DNA glycosylase AlkZ-like